MGEDAKSDFQYIRDKLDKLSDLISKQGVINQGVANTIKDLANTVASLCKVVESLQSRVLRIETERKATWKWLVAGASVGSGVALILIGALQVWVSYICNQ